MCVAVCVTVHIQCVRRYYTIDVATIATEPSRHHCACCQPRHRRLIRAYRKIFTPPFFSKRSRSSLFSNTHTNTHRRTHAHRRTHTETNRQAHCTSIFGTFNSLSRLWKEYDQINIEMHRGKKILTYSWFICASLILIHCFNRIQISVQILCVRAIKRQQQQHHHDSWHFVWWSMWFHQRCVSHFSCVWYH